MQAALIFFVKFFWEVLDAAKCADVVLCVVGPHASLEDGTVHFYTKNSLSYKDSRFGGGFKHFWNFHPYLGKMNPF